MMESIGMNAKQCASKLLGCDFKKKLQCFLISINLSRHVYLVLFKTYVYAFKSVIKVTDQLYVTSF